VAGIGKIIFHINQTPGRGCHKFNNKPTHTCGDIERERKANNLNWKYELSSLAFDTIKLGVNLITHIRSLFQACVNVNSHLWGPTQQSHKNSVYHASKNKTRGVETPDQVTDWHASLVMLDVYVQKTFIFLCSCARTIKQMRICALRRRPHAALHVFPPPKTPHA